MVSIIKRSILVCSLAHEICWAAALKPPAAFLSCRWMPFSPLRSFSSSYASHHGVQISSHVRQRGTWPRCWVAGLLSFLKAEMASGKMLPGIEAAHLYSLYRRRRCYYSIYPWLANYPDRYNKPHGQVFSLLTREAAARQKAGCWRPQSITNAPRRILKIVNWSSEH